MPTQPKTIFFIDYLQRFYWWPSYLTDICFAWYMLYKMETKAGFKPQEKKFEDYQ